MAFVVGLTGGIGSGKSSAANIFAELGARVVDTDEIAHRLTQPGTPALSRIRQKLGEEFILPDGGFDRLRVRQKVFSDALARKQLEAILHPMILEQASENIEVATEPYVLLVVPLLIETAAFLALTQRVLVVDCTEERQIERVVARSGMSEEEARAIISTQAPRSLRLARADDVLDNEGSVERLREHVRVLHTKYLALARGFFG